MRLLAGAGKRLMQSSVLDRILDQLDASPTPSEAEEYEEAAPAEMEARRREVWNRAQYLPDKVRAERAGKGDGVDAGHVAARNPREWRGQDDCDCRGLASLRNPEQARWKVDRVPGHKKGYCRRTSCECCAPQPARGGEQMCSCRAQQDGFCQRCWYDYYCGYRSVPNTFLNK